MQVEQIASVKVRPVLANSWSAGVSCSSQPASSGQCSGSPGRALIKGHTETGENVAGNPVWVFDLEVTPEGGAPYAVQKREIVSSAAIGSYPDGESLACRIDPADPQKVAFGE